jgi:hypothetical protein
MPWRCFREFMVCQHINKIKLSSYFIIVYLSNILNIRQSLFAYTPFVFIFCWNNKICRFKFKIVSLKMLTKNILIIF